MNIKKVSLSDIDDDNSEFVKHLERRFVEEGFDKKLEAIIAQSIEIHKKRYGNQKE
jgi:hypothetical protein